MDASKATTQRSFWFAAIIAMAVVTLMGFWFLLGQRYSPENYSAQPTTPYMVEFTWFGTALVVAVCGLVMLGRRRDVWRDVVCAGLPVTAISILVLSKVCMHATLCMYDMMLFAVAGGWATLLWLRGKEWLIATRPMLALRIGVWSAIALLAVYQFWQQVGYWNDLALGYADCGENARLMFNTLTNPRELFLRVNPNKPLFYDHFCPGIIPFVPLWLVWPSLKLTMVLQIVAVFGVALPLYQIGRRAFGAETPALMLVIAWLVYPSTSQFIYSASYGFRFGNICLLLYFLALAAWWKGRWGRALAFAVWAILIKEEAAIIVGMFGVYLALFKHRRAAGIGLAVCAFGYFLVATSWIIPAISEESYAMTRFFYDLGHTKWEILLSPFTKPSVFWGKLFEPASLYFGVALLGPLLFLPLRRPAVLSIGALTYVFCCMHPILKNLCFHYQAALMAIAFMALIEAVQHDEPNRRNNALAGVVVSGLLFSIFLGAQPWSKPTLTIHRLLGRLELVRKFAKQIDSQGALFATQRVAAHFVTQRYLYLDAPVPENMDYALLDLRDSWRGGSGSLDWLQKHRKLQQEVEEHANLRLVSAEDGLLLYSRRDPAMDRQKLVQRNELPDAVNRSRIDIDGCVRIAGFEVTPVARIAGDRMDRVRVTTFSTIQMPTNVDVAVQCIVHTGSDPTEAESYATDFQPLGQGIWPIAQWNTNKFYADDFIVALPTGLAEEISSVSFTAVVLSP